MIEEKLKQQDIFGDKEKYCTVSKDTTVSGLEEMEDKSFSKYCLKHYYLIDKLKTIGLPKKGEQFRLVTRRTFNTIQMIQFIADREMIIDLKIAIYSINFNAAVILIDLVNKQKIETVEILMSNLRNKAHREKEEIIKNLFADHKKIKLFFCSSHAKIFSCKTKQNNFYTVEGSGNMSFNSRVEQYVFDNDEKMYLFTCEWFNEIKDFLAGKKELEIC
jgi:hypothetical protein